MSKRLPPSTFEELEEVTDPITSKKIKRAFTIDYKLKLVKEISTSSITAVALKNNIQVDGGKIRTN